MQWTAFGESENAMKRRKALLSEEKLLVRDKVNKASKRASEMREHSHSTRPFKTPVLKNFIISRVLSYAHPNVSKYRILRMIQFQEFLANLILRKPES